MTNEATINIGYLKFLLAKICKFVNGLSQTIMNEVFQINKCPYNSRNPRILASKHQSTTK